MKKVSLSICLLLSIACFSQRVVIDSFKIETVDQYIGVYLDGSDTTYKSILKSLAVDIPVADKINRSYLLVLQDTNTLYINMAGNIIVKNNDKAIRILVTLLLERIKQERSPSRGTLLQGQYFLQPTNLSH